VKKRAALMTKRCRRAPLPEWLQNRAEWSGLSVVAPSAETNDLYGAPAMRAVVRGKANDRTLALLVTVPISRAFVRQLQESTKLHLQPLFGRPGALGSGMEIAE
jgi:hypothetical protein